ncbi:hydrolase [Hyunsoonleella sp. SJ7]|uniref:Hydrolase n=1 Tax=Hyunsoonleella aquatilis TaxID=2762758 RepID=A0A923HCP2_9FLAO|nr:hydrolase [Hyunsoonleella aquatilis]MBC3758999.1 hydrolase [Hyunsoonleella aquatilis]
MKQKIFMYLFVFSILLVLFQYVNSKRIFEDQNNKLEKAKAKVAMLKDSLATMNDSFLRQSHFNLERNEDAISYFEDEGHNVSALVPLIKDELYSLNTAKGQHPVVPYASSDGKKMLINTVKLLNHKWIIADFSDGQYWGEVLLAYEVSKDEKVTFSLIESFLYPFD